MRNNTTTTAAVCVCVDALLVSMMKNCFQAASVVNKTARTMSGTVWTGNYVNSH